MKKDELHEIIKKKNKEIELKDELIEIAIKNFRIAAEQAYRISTGNVSHNAKSLEGTLKQAYEFLEKHK